MEDLGKQRQLRTAPESRKSAVAQMRLVAQKSELAADALLCSELTDSAIELMLYTAEHLKGLDQYQADKAGLQGAPIK